MENNDTGWLVYKVELEWLPGGLERMPNEIVISNSQKYIPFQKLESANAEITKLQKQLKKAIEMSDNVEHILKYADIEFGWLEALDNSNKEFLTTLADASGENSKPGHYTIDAESFDKLIEDLDKEPSEIIKKAREKFLRLKKEK